VGTFGLPWYSPPWVLCEGMEARLRAVVMYVRLVASLRRSRTFCRAFEGSVRLGRVFGLFFEGRKEGGSDE
jgi:hypothetical protein